MPVLGLKNLQQSPLDKKELLTGREWYHQRFDGCPLFIFAIADAELHKEGRKLHGNYPKVRLCYFGDGKADWHLDLADVGRGVDELMASIEKKPEFTKKLIGQWKKDEAEFVRFFAAFRPELLNRLTAADLVALWNHYYSLAIRCMSGTGIIDHFSLGTDKLLAARVRSEVQSLTPKKVWKESEIAQLFSEITAPTHRSFLSDAEISLLQCKTKKDFQKHAAKYFWIKNNYYQAHQLTEKDFSSERALRNLTSARVGAEIKRLQNGPAQHAKAKKSILAKYKLSKVTRSLIAASDDFTAWQDRRKRFTYYNIYLGSKMLEEVARRTGYSLDQLKHATAREIPAVLKKKGPTKKELEARFAGSVFVITPQGYRVATGAAVERVRTLVSDERKEKTVNDFRGMPACLGRVTGVVRVVTSATEIGRVQQGDILVAVMTRPDYVPAMRKASAIVTDEGGVTSHAAIVSRELAVPCVIGTRVATKVLKDGDLVEVDADHGVVRILKRS